MARAPSADDPDRVCGGLLAAANGEASAAGYEEARALPGTGRAAGTVLDSRGRAMQQWGYREMHVWPHDGRWVGDDGHTSGVLPESREGASPATQFVTQALNKWGNEGWELVAALPEGEMYRLFFKRPKAQPHWSG